MAKNIIIRKGKDKIEICKDGELIADIIIAKSSRTCNVSLAIQAEQDVRINQIGRAHV